MDTIIVSDKKRESWIDMAKAISIIAVLVDHTFGFLYTNPKIQFFSFFSVSLFIFVFGVVSFASYSKYNGPAFKKLLKTLWKILRPYLWATFVLGIYDDRKFDWSLFINRAIHFNIRLPFYYVILYLQLALLVPVIIYFFDQIEYLKLRHIYEVLGLAAVIFVSSLTTEYTNIAGIYGGGGKLFGGTYLILLYIGMWFGKYKEFVTKEMKILIPVLALLILITIIWLRCISNDLFKVDTFFPFGYGLNPPGISLMLYAILVAMVLFVTERVFAHNRILNLFYTVCSRFGKHTLYIFLYHMLFLGGFTEKLLNKIGICINSPVLTKAIVVFSMLIGPIIIDFCFEKIHGVFVNVYSNEIIKGK